MIERENYMGRGGNYENTTVQRLREGLRKPNPTSCPRVFLMVLKMSSCRSKKHSREDPGMRFKGRLAVRTSLVTVTCKVSARRLGCYWQSREEKISKLGTFFLGKTTVGSLSLGVCDSLVIGFCCLAGRKGGLTGQWARTIHEHGARPRVLRARVFWTRVILVQSLHIALKWCFENVTFHSIEYGKTQKRVFSALVPDTKSGVKCRTSRELNKRLWSLTRENKGLFSFAFD